MRSPWASILRLLICAAVLTACGAGRSAECSANKDCPETQLCVANHCVGSGCGIGSQGCSANADCGPTGTCANGCCQQTQVSGCKNDTECASKPSTPYCDPGSGACVQCFQANHCAQGKLCQQHLCSTQPGCSTSADCHDKKLPVCDTTVRVCVQCKQGSDCTDPATPICDGNDHCVAPVVCRANSDCAKPTPVCQTSTGNCVTCLADADCPSAFACSAQHTCVLKGAGTCKTDSDCAANTSAPHCKQSGVPGQQGTCVQCTDPSQCPSGDVCAGDNTCQVKQCQSDANCSAPTARCDLSQTPPACVPCLADGDCSAEAGHFCRLADHACVACLQSSNCSDPFNPRCVQNTCQPLCAADADCPAATPRCLSSGGSPAACVRCLGTADCPSGQKCKADHSCGPPCTKATQGTDCAPPAPVCKESSGGNACVQCVADADCKDANKICSSGNTCVQRPAACDVPPQCTASNNCCPSGLVCDTASTPRACVQCLQDSDCTNGYLCDMGSNTCKPPPAGGLNQPCGANDSCNAGLLCIADTSNKKTCLLQCDPYAAGDPCAGAAGTACEWLGFDASSKLFGFCAAPNGHGKAGAACDPAAVDSCEWNLLCAPTGASTGACQPLCNPSGGTCAGGVCNSIAGALSISGAALSLGYCGPTSKWGIACSTDAPASGVPDCGSGIAGRSSSSIYCAPTTLLAENPAVNVVKTCQYTPASASAVGGPASDCSSLGGDACRTGLCLTNGPDTCFTGCSVNADCQRDENSAPCTSGNCYSSNPTYCLDVPLSTPAGASGRIGSCVPGCVNESDCARVNGGKGFARTCVAQPTHLKSSWKTMCAPIAGGGRAGAKCAAGGDCESGTCMSAATLQAIELGSSPAGLVATDGFCLGSCLQPNGICRGSADGTSCTTSDSRAGFCSGQVCKASCSIDSDCTIGDHCTANLCDMNECGQGSGMRCDGYAALPLGSAVYGYPIYGVCFGVTCATDGDCAGFSKDPATPRVCAPYKLSLVSTTANAKNCTADSQCTSSPYLGVCNSAANNPNPDGAFSNGGIYGANGKCRAVQFTSQCAPSLGAGKGGPGASCAKNADCKTGHCNAGRCFGGCASDGDCAAGTTCQANTYLGMAGLKSCQP